MTGAPTEEGGSSKNKGDSLEKNAANSTSQNRTHQQASQNRTHQHEGYTEENFNQQFQNAAMEVNPSWRNHSSRWLDLNSKKKKEEAEARELLVGEAKKAEIEAQNGDSMLKSSLTLTLTLTLTLIGG